MNSFPAALCQVSLVFLVGLGSLTAQEKPASTPSAPYIRNAPTNASWTVVHRKSNETGGENKSAGEAPPKPGKAVLRTTEVTKIGPDRCEIEEWSDGSKVEKWYYKGYHIFEQRGSKDIYVVDSSKDGFQRLTFPDYSKQDFPELNWLSAKTYVGEDAHQGKTGYLFEQPSDVAAGPVIAQVKAATGTDVTQKPTKTAPRMTKVWIDPKSRLPIAIDNGMRTKTYTYRESSRTQAQPPEPFLKALQDYQRSRQAPQAG